MLLTLFNSVAMPLASAPGALLLLLSGSAAPAVPLIPNPFYVYVRGRNFPAKRVAEVIIYTVDFSGELAPGETIVSAVWTNQVNIGIDGMPGAMIWGAASITGSKVSQKITGGVADASYGLICTARTSQGEVLILPESNLSMLLVRA